MNTLAMMIINGRYVSPSFYKEIDIDFFQLKLDLSAYYHIPHMPHIHYPKLTGKPVFYIVNSFSQKDNMIYIYIAHVVFKT